MPYLDLSDAVLSKYYDKTVTIIPAMMFHDLQGKPMMMKESTMTSWTPKVKKTK